MQFTFNPEARPWQPDAAVTSTWGRAGKDGLSAAQRSAHRQGQGNPLPDIASDESAFPALGASSKPVQGSIPVVDAARNDDSNKPGGVAAVEGFSWASLVSHKTNPPPARSPAPAQASLLTAALAGSPDADAQVQLLR